jgi:DNA-binding beta-propeller fold protein YncE
MMLASSCQNPSDPNTNGSKDIRLHTDLAVRAFGNSAYILERHGRDNIIKIKYTPPTPSTISIATATIAADYSAADFEIISTDGHSVYLKDLEIEYQERIGTGLNIQDIAVISETKAYISSHNSSGLIIFNPSTGKRESTIDLSRFNTYTGTDSAETSPFASALAVYGNYLYAACQRLKTVQEPWGTNIVPADTSLIAIIDTRTDEIVGEIKLNKKNPAAMSIHGNMMLVSSTGNWDDPSSSGVEMIDLTGNENLGVIVDGGNFGGNISNAVFVSPEKAYIGVTLDDWSVGIFPFNPTTGTASTKIDGIGDGFGGMAYDGQYVYIGDRGFGAAGVAVVDPTTNTVKQKINTGMPPSALAVIYTD